jgi:rhodanese-related sulfurtransferase
MNRVFSRVVWVILTAFVVLPTFMYVFLIERTPRVDAIEARRKILNEHAQVVLLEDVPEEHLVGYNGATTPLSRISKERPVLLFCQGGIRSAFVARRLQSQGFAQAYSVKGGVQEWIVSGAGVEQNDLKRAIYDYSDIGLPFREASWFEQGLVVFSFFGLKTFYTLLAALLGIILLLYRKKESKNLLIALGCFLFGESCCFVNVMVFSERSVLFEHLHGTFMVLSLAAIVFVVFHRMEVGWRLETDSRECQLKSLCGDCALRQGRSCRFFRVIQLSVGCLAAVALLPVTAELQNEAYVTRVFGFFHGYHHPIVHQLYELRYLPCVAFALYGFVLLGLLTKSVPRSGLIVIASAATGALLFSYLRLMFVAPFASRLHWFAFWEEFTEFIYIVAIGAMLWLFRDESRLKTPRSDV